MTLPPPFSSPCFSHQPLVPPLHCAANGLILYLCVWREARVVCLCQGTVKYACVSIRVLFILVFSEWTEMRQKGEWKEGETSQSFPFVVPPHGISKEEEPNHNRVCVMSTCVDLALFVRKAWWHSFIQRSNVVCAISCSLRQEFFTQRP